MHVRQQIRERVANALLGLGPTGTRVYRSRVYPLQEAQLPGLLVYTKLEGSEKTTQGKSATLIRDVTVLVEGHVLATADLDDELDQIAAEVEDALGSDQTLSGLAKDFSGIEETRVELGVEGEISYGVIQLDFTYTYATKITDSQTAA